MDVGIQFLRLINCVSISLRFSFFILIFCTQNYDFLSKTNLFDVFFKKMINHTFTANLRKQALITSKNVTKVFSHFRNPVCLNKNSVPKEKNKLVRDFVEYDWKKFPSQFGVPTQQSGVADCLVCLSLLE